MQDITLDPNLTETSTQLLSVAESYAIMILNILKNKMGKSAPRFMYGTDISKYVYERVGESDLDSIAASIEEDIVLLPSLSLCTASLKLVPNLNGTSDLLIAISLEYIQADGTIAPLQLQYTAKKSISSSIDIDLTVLTEDEEN